MDSNEKETALAVIGTGRQESARTCDTGREPWVLNDHNAAQIFQSASMGLKEYAIARSVGLSPNVFSEKKNQFPEIDDLIASGRAHGAEKLMQFSWAAASNPTSKAQSSELDRLHRILKTEVPDEGDKSSDTPQEFEGFDCVVLIPKEKAA